MSGELATTYAQYDLHLNLVDAMDDSGDIITGFAIRSDELTSFLFDLKQLVARHGGVDYLELLDNDLADASVTAAVRTSMAAEATKGVDDTIVA